MTSVIRLPGGGYRILTKGASEIVLSLCVNVCDEGGKVTPLDDATRKDLLVFIETMASSALRTLVLAYRDVPATFDLDNDVLDVDLALICIVGIKDPLRAEVPDAIKACRRAGITVRMVTGDNISTAKAIAKECGIFGEGSTALEGSVWRKMSNDEQMAIIPTLHVLARSSPTDKLLLVQRFVTGGEGVLTAGG